jgi:hypothetical protein
MFLYRDPEKASEAAKAGEAQEVAGAEAADEGKQQEEELDEEGGYGDGFN